MFFRRHRQSLTRALDAAVQVGSGTVRSADGGGIAACNDLVRRYAMVEDQTRTYGSVSSATGLHSVHDGLEFTVLRIAGP